MKDGTCQNEFHSIFCFVERAFGNEVPPSPIKDVAYLRGCSSTKTKNADVVHFVVVGWHGICQHSTNSFRIVRTDMEQENFVAFFVEISGCYLALTNNVDNLVVNRCRENCSRMNFRRLVFATTVERCCRRRCRPRRSWRRMMWEKKRRDVSFQSSRSKRTIRWRRGRNDAN